MSDSENIMSKMSFYMRPHNICICKGVSEEKIKDAVKRQGARNFTEIQRLTSCSTGCGTCEGRVKELLEKILNHEIK
ncbi:MAG: (2Fe-2S)-binding protein [Spirochaetia bacterium]|nr:(2Fe-2S)-binding protein [Spirochaetia bacterium]